MPNARRSAPISLLKLQHKALRQAARSSLLTFTTYTFPQYRAEPAHRLVAAHLEAVERGDIDRLMVWMPPQHGKSELTSIRFPAWFLGRNSDAPVILTSYGADLAYSFSRQCRNLVEGDRYQGVFPGRSTAGDSRAVNAWQVAGQRGGMIAAGVRGPITGHGGLLGIIDDPIKDWEEAQSPTYREAAWQWYAATFLTRIWEDGRIVLVMTRWHEDDLAGRILQHEPGRWRVLRLPALAETDAERERSNERLGLHDERDPLGRAPGEPLCPRRYGAATLQERARTAGSVVWSGLGQQNPLPAEGNRFKRAWFVVVERMDCSAVARVRYWDKAATSGGGCYTAGVRMALGSDGIFYVEDVAAGQWGTNERREAQRRTMEADGPEVAQWLEQEGGSAGVDVAVDEARYFAGLPLHQDRPTGSKDVRLEPFAAQCEAGNVRLVRGNWNTAYIDELCAVPNGQYRDQADASAGACNKLIAGRPVEYGPSPLSGYRG